MPELPICTKCGYRHPVPRFDQLQQPGRPACDREPRTLAAALRELVITADDETGDR